MPVNCVENTGIYNAHMVKYVFTSFHKLHVIQWWKQKETEHCYCHGGKSSNCFSGRLYVVLVMGVMQYIHKHIIWLYWL